MNDYDKLKQTKLFTEHKQKGLIDSCYAECADDFSFCKSDCFLYNRCKQLTEDYKKNMKKIHESFENSDYIPGVPEIDCPTNKQFGIPADIVNAIEDLARAAAREETYKVLTEIETEQSRQGGN